MTVHKTLDDLQIERAAIKSQLNAIDAAIRVEKSKTLVRCESSVLGRGCGQAFEVRELEYIQTYWYETPHGCTGGDTWHPGDGEFICPACGVRNRLYSRPAIEKLKGLFKSVVEAYKR